MIEKSDSKWVPLAMVSILGQPPSVSATNPRGSKVSTRCGRYLGN
ncbi:MAG: hypothetical protein V3V31_13395 [Methylococcales bacterium]